MTAALFALTVTATSLVSPVAPTLEGYATWYDYRPNQAAAGPELRRALGSGWRGQSVDVCVGNVCTTVRLTDWCACGQRNGKPTLIDLDRRAFAALSSPSRGVIMVSVRPTAKDMTWAPTPPPTETSPTGSTPFPSQLMKRPE